MLIFFISLSTVITLPYIALTIFERAITIRVDTEKKQRYYTKNEAKRLRAAIFAIAEELLLNGEQ